MLLAVAQSRSLGGGIHPKTPHFQNTPTFLQPKTPHVGDRNTAGGLKSFRQEEKRKEKEKENVHLKTSLSTPLMRVGQLTMLHYVLFLMI